MGAKGTASIRWTADTIMERVGNYYVPRVIVNAVWTFNKHTQQVVSDEE